MKELTEVPQSPVGAPIPLDPSDEQIYDSKFVSSLFDEMSATYGITNYISSFGFCDRWRRQAVEGAHVRPGMVVIDLMTGMGECWGFIQHHLHGMGRIIAVDLSAEMIRRARDNRRRFPNVAIDILQDDALCSELADGIADRIIASFGLKTLSPRQIERFSFEVWRTLKPGGRFSFVEISVPTNWLLRALYLLYLRYAIPVIGRIFLGNPDNYRMLGVYTTLFAQGADVAASFETRGFRVNVEKLFFGCARRISGSKPLSPDSACEPST